VSGEGVELRSSFDQPLQHRIGVDFEHPRCPPDAHAFGQARHHAHDEFDGCMLAMQERAERLEKIATTDTTQQLSPGTATGMAIGPEIAPAHPATIGTVWVRAAMRGGAHLAAASPCGHDARWRGGGCLWMEVAGMFTGVAVRLCGEARNGCGLTMALWHWGCGLWCWRARGSGVAWPRPLEHDAQPHKSDQHQLVEKEIGDHGKTPSYRWRNEGILPGFQTVGISRKLEVHDPVRSIHNIGQIG
jgi:hypothetical protein